jgi:hypothetical protein
MKWCLALFVLVALADGAAADGLSPGVSQRVVRINATGSKDVYNRSFADCFDSEDCLISLTRAVSQSGGNPGLLKNGETAVARIEGQRHFYSFKPAEGERHCAAALISHSAAPSFQSQAPEIRLELSASAVTIEVVLPEKVERSWVDGFLILYGAAPGAARACTLTEEAVMHHCKGPCGAMRF